MVSVVEPPELHECESHNDHDELAPFFSDNLASIIIADNTRKMKMSEMIERLPSSGLGCAPCQKICGVNNLP